MGLKSDDKCLANVADDEPIFVLRAQDKLAPEIVQHWADMAALHGCPSAKVDEARALADRMVVWGEDNGAKYPD